MTKKNNQKKRGFTLIELLVVMAIIGLLAGLLLPVLGKAKQKARKAKSKSNQHQIGAGYTSFLGDNEGWFPMVSGPASIGGKQGTAIGQMRIDKDGNPVTNNRGVFGLFRREKLQTGPLPEIVAQLYGAKVAEKDRPLNDHVGDPEVFHDPSDIGGAAYNFDSCWEQLGNSYQPQTADDMFRVKRVLGEINIPPDEEGSYANTPMHESEMTRTDNKIIQGDWNWPYDKEDTWHGLKGEGRHIMLYGDMHVDEFVFPPTEQILNWIAKPPHGNMEVPDPNYQWW